MGKFTIVISSFAVRFLNAGDTFSGQFSYDSSCVTVDDHEGVIVITESAGNALRGSLVVKVKGQVRSFDIRGFFHVGSKRLFLSPMDPGSKSLGFICEFSHENAAICKVVKDNMATECGTFTIKRDFTGTHSSL